MESRQFLVKRASSYLRAFHCHFTKLRNTQSATSCVRFDLSFITLTWEPPSLTVHLSWLVYLSPSRPTLCSILLHLVDLLYALFSSLKMSNTDSLGRPLEAKPEVSADELVALRSEVAALKVWIILPINPNMPSLLICCCRYHTPTLLRFQCRSFVPTRVVELFIITIIWSELSTPYATLFLYFLF